MSDDNAFRTWLFAFAATTVAVVVCIAYVDRPVALFFDELLRHTVAWVWLSRALVPLDLVVISLLLFLLSSRAWPDPAYIQNRVYEFRLLHGSPYWDSFPSGTAAISAAIASVLWIKMPRWRAMSAVIVVLLCVAVVITNYHWVGDVIAGAFLGTSIGWMTVRLHRAFGLHASD
jgi:membrane-associated phospholipid phosphatase